MTARRWPTDMGSDGSAGSSKHLNHSGRSEEPRWLGARTTTGSWELRQACCLSPQHTWYGPGVSATLLPPPLSWAWRETPLKEFILGPALIRVFFSGLVGHSEQIEQKLRRFLRNWDRINADDKKRTSPPRPAKASHLPLDYISDQTFDQISVF